MEKRALIAVVLSILVLILYQEWVSRRYERPPSAPSEGAPTKAPEPALSNKPTPRPAEIKGSAPGDEPAVKEVRVETDRYVAVFTNHGGRLKRFALKKYRISVAENSPPFEMVASVPGVPYPMGVELAGPTPYNDRELVYAVEGRDLRLRGDAQGAVIFRGTTPSGAVVVKKFTFTGSSYPIDFELSVEDGKGASTPAVLLTSAGQAQELPRDALFEGVLALVNNKIRREAADEVQKGIDLKGALSWAGFGYTYFLFSLLPENEGEYQVAAREVGPALVMEVRTLAANGARPSARFTLFIGPKDLDILRSVGRALERSIDFGYFAFVAIPLLSVMHFSHRLTGSYGIDIILLTILIKILLAPLTHKSFVSMKRMQKLQPQMERIKERFKDDREKLNKEVMELYRRNKVNPLGGCLPMLLQFPVFIGLYNALLTPIELRHAPFLWIKDLSRPDWESMPFALGGWNLGIPVLTLLMGASMFIQQWMTPSVGDPNQRRMMMMMPIVFTAMFVTFPAGLTIYWLVNNVLTIAQQYLINRMDH
jgi:YidC/Oxa1 family membrane protein insertase